MKTYKTGGFCHNEDIFAPNGPLDNWTDIHYLQYLLTLSMLIKMYVHAIYSWVA